MVLTLEMASPCICRAPLVGHWCTSPPLFHQETQEMCKHTQPHQPEYHPRGIFHKNSSYFHCAPDPAAAEANGRVRPNLSGHWVRPQWKRCNFTARQASTLKPLGLFLLTRRRTFPSAFCFLDAKVPAKPPRSVVETRVLRLCFCSLSAYGRYYT